MMQVPIVWTIAGSDSGGGAGIQADLNTFRSFEVHGCSVITTITAQNSAETSALIPLTAGAIRQQLQCLQKDLPPVAIKIGLLSNAEQLQAVADFLSQWPDYLTRPYVVWDPVIISTQQDRLSQLKADYCAQLFPLIDLVTPNVDELSWLSGIMVTDESSLKNAASALIQVGLSQVLVTGVNAQKNTIVYDHLFSKNDENLYLQQRLDTIHSHGTGCTLSSAIAAVLAQGYPIEDAIVLASAYVHQGLQQSFGIGKGPGPVRHTQWPETLSCFPELRKPNQHPVVSGFTQLDEEPMLYPIVDSFEWIEKLLSVGVKTLQLRIKEAPSKRVETEILESIRLAKSYGAQLFINDHWELAIKYGAYGVHLGQEDLCYANLHAIQQANLRLGISTHSYSEILIAYAYRPSYIALGHIFATQTKAMPSRPQGLKRLNKYVSLLAPHKIPTVAIGGISMDKVSQVYASGVTGIAVVSAITQASDTEHAVRQLQLEMKSKSKSESSYAD